MGSKPKSQLGFIDFIIRPSFEALQEHLSSIGTSILPLVEDNYEFWQQQLQKEEEKDEDDNNLSPSIKNSNSNKDTTVVDDHRNIKNKLSSSSSSLSLLSSSSFKNLHQDTLDKKEFLQ